VDATEKGEVKVEAEAAADPCAAAAVSQTSKVNERELALAVRLLCLLLCIASVPMLPALGPLLRGSEGG